MSPDHSHRGKKLPGLTLVCLLAFSVASGQRDPSDSLGRQVGALLRDGRTAEAEEILRKTLRSRSDNLHALTLLGVVLDQQSRYEEAERTYKQALKLSPDSPSLHNNVGNHYQVRGRPDEARKHFLKVLAVQPRHSNANLQLAKISLDAGKPADALTHVSRLSSEEQSSPGVRLLRAQALYRAGQEKEAQDLVAGLEPSASGDSRLAFSLAMVLVDWKRFEEAERLFSAALLAAPSDVTILYNLGLAATRAGHLDRAREVFETALRQQPGNVDCLYGLATVHAQTENGYEAAALLLKAQRLAPERPEIPLFLARLSEKMGLAGDAAIAYDAYLRLRPDDGQARRDRGFALARSGNVREGLKDLQWYVEKHPADARGLYALGLAETAGDRAKALRHLDEAIRIDGAMLEARYARAVLKLQALAPEDAVRDLELCLKRNPGDEQALGQLGHAYLLLDRPHDAADVLARALQKSPNNSSLLFHYSKALQKLDRQQEYRSVLERFRQAAAQEAPRRPAAGLLEYLNLPPGEQQNRTIENLRRSAEANPRDASRKAALAQALLEFGKTEEALVVFREIRVLALDPAGMAACGKTLLRHGQFALAKDFLEAAASSGIAGADALLDLSLANFHVDGAQAALMVLERLPDQQRKGDYFLFRAQLLDALGKFPEAVESLNQGFRAAPERPDLYFQGTLFLIKHERYQETLELLRGATRRFPDSGELILVEAIVLELLKQTEEARKLLRRVNSRWPEWDLPYLIHGIILESHLFSAEARPLLETAIHLGTTDPAAYYYFALATTRATPDDTETVEKAILEAVRLSPEDPYIRSLAGRTALRRKDYVAAENHLSTALRVMPELVEARYALGAVYGALGQKDRADIELEQARRLERESALSGKSGVAIRDLLFAIGGRNRAPVK